MSGTEPTSKRRWRAVKLETVTVWGVRSDDGREMAVVGRLFPTVEDARELARHLNGGGT